MVYLEASIQGFSLKIVIRFRYTWGISVGDSFPVKLQAVCLPFWWKWVPSWVFLKYFAYFIIYCVNGCFEETHGGCFIILTTLFILILDGRKVFWRELFAGGFLRNNWYCINCLLNINSALVVWKGFLHRWSVYWCNTFINLQFL